MSDELPAHHELDTKSRRELAEHIATIESLTEEKKAVGEKIKAEYAEAASSGFDKKAIQQIIKERAADAQKSIEQRAVTATYRRALGSLTGTPLGDWARNWMGQEARLNRSAETGTTPEMDAFMKKRGEKNSGDKPAAPLAN